MYRHKWTPDDDLIAYCLYRLGTSVFDMYPDNIASLLGMSSASLSKKLSNFQALAGAHGLDGYSKQAATVFSTWAARSDAELLAAGRAALRRARGTYKSTSIAG